MTCGLENEIRNKASFTRALESLKIGILMGSFNPKLKKYKLKIHRGVICHDNEEWCKIWRGIDLSFQNWHEEFDEFWPEHLKVSKIFILMCFFWAKYILFELKSADELSLMKLNMDTKFGQELSCHFKIDKRNLTIFDLSTRKSKRLSLYWTPFEQSIYCLRYKAHRSYR